MSAPVDLDQLAALQALRRGFGDVQVLKLLRQLPKREAVLLYGNKPPIRMRLRPWWTDRVLKACGSAS
jgi:hypothetical protein